MKYSIALSIVSVFKNKQQGLKKIVISLGKLDMKSNTKSSSLAFEEPR